MTEVKNVSFNKKRKAVVCIETSQGFVSIARASKELGLSEVCIINCIAGRQKTTGGYTFRLATQEEIIELNK